MSNDISIKVSNLKKTFKIFHRKENTFFEKSINLLNKKNNFEFLPVIDNVSFELKKGEMLGIIGKNGSGKTTLLKLIAKIFEPDGGAVFTQGTILPLLGLGIGFEPEFSARENIIQYGIILGFSKTQITSKLDDIFEFSELKKFEDTKIKNFSSGMISRIAFATAVEVNPDILLVDEILAVGDQKFREKSYEKFFEFKKNKKSILYVSHNLNSISKLCDRAILLHKGKILAEGEPSKVINSYQELLNDSKS